MNERLPYLREKTYGLTLSPGVYIMKDKSGKIIYIGKAKNLKNRVTSYFRETPDHTPKVAKMVSLVYDYDFIVTDSEYEALVLECSLIKQHKPKYNILLKDDKGYHYIKISKEAYPRITAEKKILDNGTYLGPYTSSYIAKQAVMEANKFFRLSSCKKKFPQDFGKQRPCLNYHINQCMGVCRGKISEKEYNEAVSQAVEYIRNGSTESIKRLREQMELASENLEFERAAVLRDRINAISHAADKQKIIDSELVNTDIIATVQNEGGACGAVLMYRNGRLWDKAVHFLGDGDINENILEDFILQYYQGKTDIPKSIIIGEEIPETEMLDKLLSEKSGHAVHIYYRQRGNMLKLLMLAKSNAGEYISIKVGRTAKEIIALEELSKLLGLQKPPEYIEAYDISNLASTAMVSGMVVFENGRPNKKAYKRFSIKNVQIQNDYACMREVLERRFKRYEEGEDEGFSRMPDIIFVDGGKGQVSAVEPMLREMGVHVPVFGIVKDNKHRTRAVAASGGEISLNSSQSAFMLLTRIQDEMHRFAITYQRTLHSKRTFELEITKVKGIGEKKAQKLILHYKTKEALKAASSADLAKIAGINEETALRLHEFIQEL